MRATLAILAAGVLACGPGSRPLHPAGSKEDEGHGLLAAASVRILVGDEAPDDGIFDPRDRGYGGAAYGGAAYGGATYAGFVVPPWPAPPVNRAPKYQQVAGLRGSIEGAVRWAGAVPSLATACGAIGPVRVAADRALANAIVYIERVHVGRVLPSEEGRAASVGGVVVKRGCALLPVAQIVTPLPASLSIHGDATRARLRVTPPPHDGEPPAVTTVELHEGGRAAVPLPAGVTRIDAEDGTLGAAWVLALDTPYYAVTDDRGRFRLDELAPGTYEVTIWQPPVPTLTRGALTYGPPTIVHRTVTVVGARTAQLDVTLGRGR